MSTRQLSLPVTILCGLAVVLVYLGPSLLSKTSGDFPLLPGVDGGYYAWRLQAALKRDSTLSCVEDPSLSARESLYPPQYERTWALLIRSWAGVDVFRAMTLTYTVLPALWYFLLTLTLLTLTNKPLLSACVAFWAVLEGGTVFWKPFLFQWSEEVLPYFRYANPMLFGLPVLCALACWFMVLRTDPDTNHKWIPWAAAASICLGVTLYTQIFYWTWAGASMALFAVWSWFQGDRKRATITAAIGIGALIIGAPQLLASLAMRSEPLITSVLHRGGVMIEGHTPYFLLYKSFWLTFLVYQAVSWKQRDWRWRALTCAMLIGWLFLNENLLTGLDIQQHHFLRPMTFLYPLVVGDGIRRLAEIFRSRSIKLPVFAIAASLMLVVGVKGALAVRYLANEYSMTTDEGKRAASFRRTLLALRELPEQGGLLADPALAYAAGLAGQRSIYVHEYTMLCLLTDTELFARWGLLWRVYGRNSDEFRKVMRAFTVDRGQPWWVYGLPDSFGGRRDQYGPTDLTAMAEASIEAYNSRTLTSFAQELRGGHGLPRFALTSPGFSLNLQDVRQVFDVELVTQIPEEGTELWRLTPRT